MQVHGHGQCATCGTNIQPCCAGDSGNDAGSCAKVSAAVEVAPGWLEDVFDHLGGPEATVTSDALLLALGARFGSDLAATKQMLGRAVRQGALVTIAPGQHRLGSGRLRDG